MRRTLALALVALCALATLAAACSPGFEDPSIVIDLRVLAIGAEPAEVVVDIDPSNPDPTGVELPPVVLTPLVADPGADRRLVWRLEACVETETGRCEDPEQTVTPRLIAEGVADDPEAPVDAEPPAIMSGSLVPDLDLILAAVEADPLGGYAGVPIQVGLRVVPEGGSEAEAVYAFRRVVYAPRFPEGRTANLNPALADLLLDGESFPGGRCGAAGVTPQLVAPGQEVEIEPVEPEGARESYVVATLDGGTRVATENFYYSWFATAGAFTRTMTGGSDVITVTPLETQWTAPTAEAAAELPDRQVRLWLIQRDDRRGVSWAERCFQVQ